MIHQIAAAENPDKPRSFFRRYGLLIMLSVFLLAADRDGIKNSSNKSGEVNEENSGEAITVNQNEPISVNDLLAWDRRGNGYFGSFGRQVLQMTEGSNSGGMTLISPEPYGTDIKLTYDVMTLRPATVLVNMLSVSDGGNSGELNIPANYNGAMGDWPDGVVDYFFAFHNAPHSRYPFIVRNGRDGGDLLGEADRNYMVSGQWYQIEITRSGGSLTLAIDEETVLEVSDPDPLGEGHIAFRIRGSGTERASCFIKNVDIEAGSN